MLRMQGAYKHKFKLVGFMVSKSETPEKPKKNLKPNCQFADAGTLMH